MRVKTAQAEQSRGLVLDALEAEERTYACDGAIGVAQQACAVGQAEQLGEVRKGTHRM